MRPDGRLDSISSVYEAISKPDLHQDSVVCKFSDKPNTNAVD